MLPPVLEVFVVWHPDDSAGIGIAQELMDHFHGTAYTGLLGGAVEVYLRNRGWNSEGDSPRPIPRPGNPPPNGVPPARYTAVVPVLGLALARAVQNSGNPWHDYLAQICQTADCRTHSFGVFPVPLGSFPGSHLDRLMERFQQTRRDGPTALDPADHTWRRDLVQALTQFVLASEHQLQVFISHTRHGYGSDAGVQFLLSEAIQRSSPMIACGDLG